MESELRVTVKEWLLSLRQQGRTKATRRKYGYNMERFTDWMEDRGVERLADLDRLTLRAWGAGQDEGERGERENNTIRQIVATTKSFLNWCRDEKLINEPLADALKLPPVRKRVQRTLSYEEVMLMLDICDDSPKGVRDCAMVSLLADSGLRASELCRLRVDDLELDYKLLGPEGIQVVNLAKVRKGKGNKDRTAYFGQVTGGRVAAWLSVRGRLNFSHSTLFVSLNNRTGKSSYGNPLTVDGLRVILRKIALKAGVKKVSTHAFRRTFACLARKAGADSRDVMGWGGWAHIEEVERYTLDYEAGPNYAAHSPADWLERIRDQVQNDK